MRGCGCPVVGWYVYVVRCGDGTLYTGIARDIRRRVVEHNTSDALAARYTRPRRPVILVYHESACSRSEALKRERAIKRLRRREKERLIAQGPPVRAAEGGQSPKGKG